MKHPNHIDRIKPANPDFTDPFPPICNLPIQRNSNFTGRRDTLSTLAETFFSGQEQASVQVIKGMGGVGKTQIALEYAYRFSSQYETIWWVRAEDEMTLAADFALFAKAAMLPERNDQNQNLIIDAVRRWLEQNQNWLIVFNHAKNPDQLSNYLPKEKNGHVLITSRHQMWEKESSTLELSFFSRKESVEFLLKRTNCTDASDAKSVAERLMDFPLALELAAAYINQTSICFSNYLILFQVRHQSLLEKRNLPLTYPDTLGATVSLALENVEEKTPAAIPMVTFFSFFADDEISKSIFSEAKKGFSDRISSLFSGSEAFEKSISTLMRYSLVNTLPGGLSLHRLVQAAVRDRLEKADQEQWAEIAVSSINYIFPAENHQDLSLWPKCVALLSHGLVAAQHAIKNKTALSITADLLDSMGSYLHARSYFEKADTFFRAALSLFEKEMGNNHPHVGAVVNNLAALYQDQGRFEEAETHFRRALEVYRTADDHLYIGTITNNLASLLWAMGNDAEAETLFRKSVYFFQTKLGDGHPQVATSLNNLAVILQDQGKHDEVEQLLRRALEIYETKQTKDHPYVATALNNLALFYQSQGKVDEAEKLLRKALTIRETQLPTNHPDIATHTVNLAGVLYEEEKYSEADALCRKALEICEKKQGSDHLQVASCVINLAKRLQDLGSHGEAEILFRKGLRVREIRLPANHPDLAAGLTNLAGVLHEQGNSTEAESVYRQALEIHKTQEESNHPDTAINLNNLAALLYEQGKHDEAELFFRQALEIFDAVLGTDHPDTAASRYNLSEFLKAVGKKEEAEELLSHLPGYFTIESL